MKLENEIRFIYKSASGESTERTVVNFRQNERYLEGYCLLRETRKTFKKSRMERIISAHFIESEEENSLVCTFGEGGQSKGKVKSNEICFTGFPKTKKEELSNIAKESGFFVRGSVTTHLDYLILGPNAGAKKISLAKKQGVVTMTEQEFVTLLDNGELPEAG